MISEKKQYRRNMIANEVIQILSDLLKRDPDIEVVSFWIKFKEQGANVPITYQKVLKFLTDSYSIKQTVLSALNYAEMEYKKDKSLGLLTIVLKTKVNTNRYGAVFNLELKNS